MLSQIKMIPGKIAAMIAAHKEKYNRALIDEAIVAVKACRVVACNKIWVGENIELFSTYLTSSIDGGDPIGVEFAGKTKNGAYCKIFYRRGYPLSINELTQDQFNTMNNPEEGLDLA